MSNVVIPASGPNDLAMVAKFEANQQAAQAAANPQGIPSAPADDTSQRPAWLPAKFATVEDLAKSYVELEKKVSGQQPATQVPAQQPVVPQVEQQATEAVQNAGLDMAALESEYATTGAVSEASLAALEKTGIPRTMVDAYIEGRKALAEQARTTVLAAVGGEEQYKTVTTWAASNLSAAEIEAYNTAVNGSVEQAKLAVVGLKAKYEAVNGRAPALLQGTTSRTVTDAYESNAQLVADMKDPRYHKDPAFRNSVLAKLARSGR